MRSIFKLKSLQGSADYLTPDKSEIRKLLEFEEGGIAHVRLPINQTSIAVKHKTVKEIWFCLSGNRKMWQEDQSGSGCVTELKHGVAYQYRLGIVFNFKIQETNH